MSDKLEKALSEIIEIAEVADATDMNMLKILMIAQAALPCANCEGHGVYEGSDLNGYPVGRACDVRESCTEARERHNDEMDAYFGIRKAT